MTGRENLQMVARLCGQSRREARSSARRVLEQLNLVEPADRLVRTYSGGMRRRLDLGASLVGAPRLLLLDEPTTGLDPRSRIELWDAIRSLVTDGTDVLLTTQYLDEADHLADQIAIIDRGRTIADGTPGELKARVGGNVIEVHTHRRDQLASTADALERLHGGRAQIDQATRTVTIGIDGSDGLFAALKALDGAGLAVDDVALRQPTLDEVFLALTGRPAADTRNPSSYAEAAAA
jgi:ABC-2 type transport system ATP-binding protein